MINLNKNKQWPDNVWIVCETMINGLGMEVRYDTCVKWD